MALAKYSWPSPKGKSTSENGLVWTPTSTVANPSGTYTMLDHIGMVDEKGNPLDSSVITVIQNEWNSSTALPSWGADTTAITDKIQENIEKQLMQENLKLTREREFKEAQMAATRARILKEKADMLAAEKAEQERQALEATEWDRW